MTKTVLIVLLAWIGLVSFEQGEVEAGEEIEIYSFDELEERINEEEEMVSVYNFWATWCKPCIEEMPAFVSLNDKYAGSDVEVVLISLDYAGHLESKLKPFLAEKNWSPEVILLDESDYNSWIDRVSETWSGAIPATLIVDHRTGEKTFIESQLTYEQLEEYLLTYIN